MTTATAQEFTVTDAIEIVRAEPYTHVVPGTYNQGLGRSESFQLVELTIDGRLVGVEIEGQVYDPCKRCGVGGHYSFDGESSTCYGCWGYSHGKATDEASIIRRFKARRKAEAKRAEQAEAARIKQAEELAAWQAANTDLAEALKPHQTPEMTEDGWFVEARYNHNGFEPADRFLTSLADQATYKALSAKQTAAAEAALARYAEKVAEKAAARGVVLAAGHWGVVGKRAEVEVTVVGCKSFDSDYGTRWLVTMKTAEGQTLKTWTSGAFVDTAIDREKDGQPIKVKATVKDHGTYRDLPETTVTRVAAV